MSRAVAADAARRPANRGLPVGLNEAALDSPTFRASAAHFADQVDTMERWLSGYVSSTSKLVHDMLALEDTINAFLVKTMPSAADAITENDYAFLALKRVADGQRECWTQALSSTKKLDTVVVEPIRSFLGGDMRNFREIRRTMELSQRAYDSTLARYVGQSKTKEASALREDAFSVWETRKAYVQASMDFCQHVPQLRFTMDMLLVKICGEMWREMSRSRDAWIGATRWVREMDRVRGWAKEMELTEAFFKRELQMARRELGERALEELKPSRELDDYSTSTVPFLGSRGPLNMGPEVKSAAVSEKQGWLFLRMASGKPVRYSWVRRWYYCRGGVFGWLMQGPQGVLQGDEIGVLLCNARPAVDEERRFCFEVKTKNQTMVLQAETQRELVEWLQVFEVTKKEAFEASMSHDSGSRPAGANPAFSISPPSAPEFSAKALDSHVGADDDLGPAFERSASLAPGSDGHAAARQSMDVNGTLGRRSFTALGRDLAMREDGESGRDHAARIIQKLDLHRKSNSGTAVDAGPAGTASSAGGIASLISASHRVLPVQPPNMVPHASRSPAGAIDSAFGSLAPLTLARPPALTSLSRTAVVVAGDGGSVADSRRLPTSLVANYWGSAVWSAVQGPRRPGTPRADDDVAGRQVAPEGSQTGPARDAEGQADGAPPPAEYPKELRAQSAQFRLLFPNAPPGERLVLVFRAAWSISLERSSSHEALAGNGRIYVTPDNMYFYSQQMGLVAAYSIHLDIITEVTSAAGKDCDFIFLHLGQGPNQGGFTRIVIKIFLDDLHLLHTRLNLLVDNLQAEEPMETRDIISALVNVERDDEGPSPSAESWEEVSAGTRVDDGASSGKPAAKHRPQREHGAHVRPSRTHQRGPPKLHLPAHQVVYEPEGEVELAAERHFEIGAKACFHVVFGDKSFVFPKLYFEHRARQIAQGPWLLADQGRMRREFHFKVDYKDLLGRPKSAEVGDHQSLDVHSDHVTYVVTHNKTAWHLPHSRSFRQVTKIVITHVAKSKCKLAIYTGIEWSKAPAFWKNLVERQALRDAANDAEELAETATDQVRKLGARRRTNRAIQMYGHVGGQTHEVLFSPAASESTRKQAVKPRTLTAMVLETARSFAESAVSSVIMWAFAGLKKLLEVVSAQRALLALLLASVLANGLLTWGESRASGAERRAARLMKSMGMGPNAVMSKAIYMADLDEASGSAGSAAPPGAANSTCSGAYRALLAATDMDAPWEEAGSTLTWAPSRATARRLRRARQRLASYRHDLVVAMRVVNGVEREMVRSEWENWLVNERALCDGLDALVRGGEGAARDARWSREVLGSEELGQWRDSHCGSCRRDLDGVLAEKAAAAA